MSTTIFDALPGVETPVDGVQSALAAVWDSNSESGIDAPSEYRASQMNLILHLGLDSTLESARAGFETAMKFSERYPCRTIALCPLPPGVSGEVLAKIYCECYLGSSSNDKVCSESVILGYPIEQRDFIENQTSIMLESDLPLYYWARGIRSAAALSQYKDFLRQANRVVFDSATENETVRNCAWPRPDRVSDLSYARILPIRQSVGHFLSYLPPARLVEGLKKIQLGHDDLRKWEATAVLGWLKRGIADCSQTAGISVENVEYSEQTQANADQALTVEFTYASGEGLKFSFNLDAGSAHLESTIPGGLNSVSSRVRFLPPEKALAEALFF